MERYNSLYCVLPLERLLVYKAQHCIEAKSVRINLISQGWMVDAFPKQLWDPALCRETGVSKCKTTLMHPNNMFGWKEGYLRGKKG